MFGIISLLLLLLPYSPSIYGNILPSRYVLFFVANQRTLNSVADYEKSFTQWAQQNRTDYIMAADTYQIGSNGSIEYYFVAGDTAEKYAYTAFNKLGLKTQAIFYIISASGLANMLTNPQPVIDELIKRAQTFGIGGYHIAYMPGVNNTNNDNSTTFINFLTQFGDALASHNLTLSVAIEACYWGYSFSCQDISAVKNLDGVITWDTAGATDIPSFQWFAQDDAKQIGSTQYCPQLFGRYFDNATDWLQINDYLLQQNYTKFSTYAWNYADQWDQPQWFFDSLNKFLDG